MVYRTSEYNPNQSYNMNRRDLLLGTLSATSIMALPSWARGSTQNKVFQSLLMDSSPIDMAPLEKLSAFGGSRVIEGDNMDEAHEIFWNKDGYLAKKGGMPKVSDSYDVVIIGGGIAGLSAAYHLNGMKILLIEGNPRLGGNSKSQVYNKSYISQGSAYITLPESGDEIDTFLKNLKLNSKFREVTSHDEKVFFGGKFIDGFWDGTTDPKRADEFKSAFKKITDVFENNYPEIPVWDNSTSARNYFNSLDSITFEAWLKQELGEVHPHVMEYITLYCWSSFSASPAEISAAQGLNFLSCDLSGTKALPGGNGLIAEAVYQDLKKRNKVTIFNNSFAVDLRSEGGSAVVCFKNATNTLVTVKARQCIVASPKLVMKKVISGLSTDQEKAMSGIGYRAYLVGNIFLKKKVRSMGYDNFMLSGTNPRREYEDSKNRVVADVVCADWAMNDQAEKSVLTLYMPLPYDMAQQYLFLDNLHEKYLDRIKPKLIPILEQMGASWSDVEGMRLVRYGHSVPVARTHGVASGLFEKASASIDNCIRFANQDNWGNPCFETSYGSALRAVEKIKG